MKITNMHKVMMISICVGLVSACDKGSRSISILSESQEFQQVTTFTPRKIDILWVIDNSGSMENSQTNLVNNFNVFINRFSSLQYDFRMAVTSTDAYRARFNGNQPLRRVRDGIIGQTSSGVRVMDPSTPNLGQVFITNATQGIAGTGDERSFSSFEDVLTYSENSDFRRQDAYLAIILLSDEDDFSHSGSSLNESYSNTNLFSIDYYKTFLDGHAGAGNYSFNAITILDPACKAILDTDFPRKIGTRHMALADATGGLKLSLCGNFADNLQLISDKILSSSQSFTIDREPVEGTLKIFVNNVEVPVDPVNGYTFDVATLTVTFNGSAVPPANASIRVLFDPKTLR